MHRLVALDDRLSLLAARLARAWCHATGTSSRALEYAVAVAIWALAVIAVVIDPARSGAGRGVNAVFIAVCSLYVFRPTSQREPARARDPVFFIFRMLFVSQAILLPLCAPLALFAGDRRWALGLILMGGNAAATAALYYLLREPPAEPEPRERAVAAPSESKA